MFENNSQLAGKESGIKWNCQAESGELEQRVRELWYSPNHGQNVTVKERNELHAAAYYLDLLRSLEAKKTFGEDPIMTNEATAAGRWTSET